MADEKKTEPAAAPAPEPSKAPPPPPATPPPPSAPRKKGRFTGMFKAVLEATGLGETITTAAKENLKIFLVTLMKGFGEKDKNDFEHLKVQATEGLETTMPGMGVCLRENFETWLASHPEWRQNCYKILVLAAPEDKRLGILKRMFQAQNNAERDQVIIDLFRNEPMASQLAENLRGRWPQIFAFIIGAFGSVARFAASFPRLTGNVVRDFDAWLNTTASDAVEPYLTADPARMGTHNINRPLDKLEEWAKRGV